MPSTDFALRTVNSACLSTPGLLYRTAPRSDHQSFYSDRPRRYSLQKLGCIPLCPDVGSLGSGTHKTSYLRLRIRQTCTHQVLWPECTPAWFCRWLLLQSKWQLWSYRREFCQDLCAARLSLPTSLSQSGSQLLSPRDPCHPVVLDQSRGSSKDTRNAQGGLCPLGSLFSLEESEAQGLRLLCMVLRLPESETRWSTGSLLMQATPCGIARASALPWCSKIFSRYLVLE